MNSIKKLYGEMVFDLSVMKERLPKETFKKLETTINEGTRLESDVASVVANAMKDWAIEKGATHYTHWFQPMSGVTAEKHDSFISPTSDGRVIMEFSGKELIQGETDASSFPSGGIRSTFEARGYTAWDPTSFAFIKEGVLCIPTAFCSYGGQALDKKTPLLRSMQTLNRETMRILKLFGNRDVKHIKVNVGCEQEYFLVSKELFDKRKDLIYTGRTLFGAKAPKGQEMEDHYVGNIKPRVSEFMRELDEELWRLGILAKTEHNEAAPAQHELAPVFTTVNIAADHDQLTMELMQKIAKKHGLVCLLHEKPFAGVNGSGKHNNWSISTDTGINLLAPGDTPYENAQFLLIVAAIIKAVDEYQDLLRISVASAGNDHRLGANEAPPAIVSIFVGEELTNVLNALKNDTLYYDTAKGLMKTGVEAMPSFAKDTTDRNRTSPFAFTGNKFEFRMLGSSASISDCNVVINTIVAEEFKRFADILESSESFDEDLHRIIKDVLNEHGRILFSGNGYDSAWHEEAEKRGLKNLRTTPDCLPELISEKNIKLFTEHKVFSEEELLSRYEIYQENYRKVINIEARTMIEMVKRDILPAVSKYTKALSDGAIAKKSVLGDIDCTYETDLVNKLTALENDAYAKANALQKALCGAKNIEGTAEKSFYFRCKVFEPMCELRKTVDAIEEDMASEYWPMPTYGELLFSL